MHQAMHQQSAAQGFTSSQAVEQAVVSLPLSLGGFTCPIDLLTANRSAETHPTLHFVPPLCLKATPSTLEDHTCRKTAVLGCRSRQTLAP